MRIVSMSPFDSSNHPLPFVRILFYYSCRAIKLTDVGLPLTTVVSEPTVVTSLATMAVASILDAMAATRAGITSANHKGKALKEGKVLELSYDLVLRVRDNVSDLGVSGVGFRDGGAGSSKEEPVGRYSGGEVRARCR
jgi:hypothetical protein